MPTAHGTVVGYNAQTAVDAKHKLIAADDVTNEVTDLHQLANMALEAKANLNLKRAEVVADAGYYNAGEVSRCLEQGITPYIPRATPAPTRRADSMARASSSMTPPRMCMCVRRVRN